ncbi:MAG: polysaccharide biosynthesis protein [Candidatus Nealsonbacteria bacterium RIFCSPLOWO2_12_FULL_39_31]|uniref:Polysaccharide biosynthesis protein n=1 Tax=Candidatus Nealsonbacteria bacterium RIFCSPLOWO2_12_FULL_39_31 TaxID=1801676 RepID=A0A1G2ENK4_9BACT|nr:MAG: polysaccharide biosynthesis protein [Candidatus Nealsonbacteria bacterium RIFCSPLOWO2_12_FULL_39_31]
MKISLSKPDIADDDRKEVLNILETPYLSLGPKLKEFEEKIAEYAGVKYAVGVSSGTAGLHLIVRALSIKNDNEIITTPFSFISSSNCIIYEGAKPVFVDIGNETLNINPELIEKAITPKTKAILAVDVFGHSADWNVLAEIAKKHNLFLIEDSAEALGSEYKYKSQIRNFSKKKPRILSSRAKFVWRKCGSFGDAAIFSFYPNKQIATGEGGIILTDNERIADLCRSMANQGRRNNGGKWLEHIRLGYNYRLDEMSCALGINQLKRISQIIEKREKIAELYNEKLKDFPEIEIPYISPNVKVSRFVYVAKLSEKFSRKERDRIISEMSDRGVQCSNYFYPIHLQPFYRKMFNYKKNDFPVCESVSQRTIALPFFNNITEEEIDFVVRNLKKIIRGLKYLL